MQELTSILLAHAARYPQMEPRDAVKLIYQNEFGGGHLIRNEAACLDRLRQEYRITPQSTKAALLEDLGNGIFRVHLAALDAHGRDIDFLGNAFLQSAACHKGSMERFREKLAVLKTMTQSGTLPFTSAELEGFLQDYEAAGCPAVSHSDRYRSAYHPAYRVVSSRFFP